MIEVTVYAYPWDILGDPHVFDRARAVGATRIALAAVYHAVRAATPQHPSHAVVEVGTSVDFVGSGISSARVHVPAGPESATWQAAAQRCWDAGLDVAAWTVLNHVDTLSSGGATVRNAFGDDYGYALCPSSPLTKEFADRVIDRVASVSSDVILEATGQLGADHQGLHDKTGQLWAGSAVHRALSFCFCVECTRQMLAEGADPEGLARMLRSVAQGEAESDETAIALLEGIRLRSGSRALASAVQRARECGVANIAVHGAPGSPTGAATAIDATRVDQWIVPAWDDPGTAQARVLAAAQTAPDIALGAYVTILSPGTSVSSIEETCRSVIRSGARAIHLYHLGLATAAQWTAAAEGLQLVGDVDDDGPAMKRNGEKW